MLKAFFANYWPFLVFFAIMALASWSNHRHNRTAARKGENPRSINLRFGRNSFRKEPELPLHRGSQDQPQLEAVMAFDR